MEDSKSASELSKRCANDHTLTSATKKTKKAKIGSKTTICRLNRVYESVAEDVDSRKNDAPQGFEIIKQPFSCFICPEFMENDIFLHELRNELKEEIEYSLKNNDLYCFKQSDDFKCCRLSRVKAIRDFFLSTVRPLLTKFTGIALFDDVVDMTASKYEYNDVLLCHDDQLEGRRIAFILYLTPEWNHSDGGELNLFDHDENKQPTRVVKSILPKWNTFVFFEVTPTSYHTVAEVLSKEKCRLSVNGWFRGPQVLKAEPYIEKYLNITKCGDTNVSEKVFNSWLNPTYLKRKTQISIQQQFSDTSEISLPNFLNEDKFSKITTLLRSEELKWIVSLPPNKRKFELLQEVPEPLAELCDVFKSEAMFLTLSNLTGLKLHPLAAVNEESSDEEESMSNTAQFNPRCRLQVRKWYKGCYTLVHDLDPDVLDESPKLDVNISFNHDFEVDRECGGFTSYITKDADEELLCVEPSSNCLSIVYVDGQTVRFRKYLNDSFSHVFHDINLVYQE